MLPDQAKLVVMRLPGRKGAYLCLHELAGITPLARLLDRVSMDEFVAQVNRGLGRKCQIVTWTPAP